MPISLTPIKTIERVTSNDTSGSSTVFPTGLSAERYIIIKIYDTSEADPNKSIAQAGGAPIEIAKQAFSGTGTASAEGVVSGLIDFGASATSDVIAAGGEFLSGLTDYGNTALAETWKDNIYLPLPNDLSESLNHNYAAESGFLQDENTPVLGTAVRTVGGLAAGASKLISKATGRQSMVFNENKLAMFTESEFRSISLTWTLIANNPTEALNIQTIITKLKAYSSPQAVAGKLLLRAPFFCRLEFPNRVINDALQFNETVMTSIEVNYSVTGHMETFLDDMPKTISLSINFQDREPKTLQAWGEGAVGYETGGA